MSPKKNITIKFDDKTKARLDRMCAVTNDSQAVVLEKALLEYEYRIASDPKKFMDLYNLLSENIQSLEIKRDTNPATGAYMQDDENYLSSDENETLEFYNNQWDQMRKQPFFSEVMPPELED